jgi:C_GCAxxG_C_C family probable redox protein
MSSREIRARMNFRDGYNCAQAVLSAFAGDFGLDEATALALARGFGGGVGRTGGLCGTVSGAVMVIGLATQNAADNKEGKDQAYRLVREFFETFRSRHESLLCRELLGCDPRVPEEWRRAHEFDLFTTVCEGLVMDAVGIAEEILQRECGAGGLCRCERSDLVFEDD